MPLHTGHTSCCSMIWHTVSDCWGMFYSYCCYTSDYYYVDMIIIEYHRYIIHCHMSNIHGGHSNSSMNVLVENFQDRIHVDTSP